MRHLRFAKPGVALILAGFVLGPSSVALLRDWTPMSSFHALLGGVAAVLFVGAALQAGDVIVRFAGKPVENDADLVRLTAAAPAASNPPARPLIGVGFTRLDLLRAASRTAEPG